MVLTSIHLPIALWFVVGLAYVADDVRSSRRRMDFIRFTGEWFVYYVLIALGGGVLIAFMFGTFKAIGIDPEDVHRAVARCPAAPWPRWWWPGGSSRPSRAWSRTSPRCSRGCSPRCSPRCCWPSSSPSAVTGAGIDVEREALILFDLLLVVVLGLLLYSISARDPLAPPGLFDKLQLALVVSALVIDVLVLLEITGRITEYGTTPEQGGGTRRERHPAGQPRLVGVAGAGLRPPAHAVRGARTLADHLPPGVRRVGLDRGPGLPAAVQLSLIQRPSPGAFEAKGTTSGLVKSPVLCGGRGLWRVVRRPLPPTVPQLPALQRSEDSLTKAVGAVFATGVSCPRFGGRCSRVTSYGGWVLNHKDPVHAIRGDRAFTDVPLPILGPFSSQIPQHPVQRHPVQPGIA